MKDVMSIFIVIVFACARGAAICYGFVGVMAHQTELIATGILLYLLSNTWEKVMDERFKEKENEDD